MRATLALPAVLLACASPDVTDTDMPVASDEVSVHTDTDPASGDTDAESDPHVDTDDAHTDLPADTDIPVDTDAPPRSPPLAWGGGFVEIGASAFTAAGVSVRPGLAPSRPPQLAHVFLTDVDGDGTRELVTDADVFFSPGATHAVHAFDVVAGELVHDDGATAALAALGGPLLGALDLDGDGDDDLLRAAYPPALYRTEDGWDDDATLTGFTDFVAWARGSWLDLDLDGWIDLATGPEGCDHHPIVLLQTAPRRFEAVDLVADGPTAEFGWAAPLPRPTGDDAVLWMHTTRCNTAPPWPGGFLVRGAARPDGRPAWTETDLTDAHALWKLDPQFAGLPYTAVMPMGALVEDLDADGRADVVPSLGYPDQLVLWGRADGGYDVRTTLRFANAGLQVEIPWAIAAPDLDADGTADLALAIGDDVTSYRVPAGASFLPLLWWGRGDRTFVDVTSALGIDVGGSWHELSVDDLDGDGDGDLLVGGYGSLTTVYRNDVSGLGRSVALRVRGTTSNGPAIGARVAVTVAGRTRTQVVGGQIGLPAAPSVHVFGAGATGSVDATITWPTGVEQVVRGLSVGAIHEVVEPPVIELSEADRHLPADGATELTVTVWPRAADGSVDPTAATVTLSTGGTAVSVTSQPAPRGDGAWIARVRAPASPGSTRLSVAIDGTTLRVAPRVWWD